MPWLALKMFLGGAIKRIMDFVTSHPCATVIIFLCGLCGILWGHYSHEVRRQATQIVAYKTAIGHMQQAEAKAHDAQVALNKAKEDQYRLLAQRKDKEYETELASVRAATGRYIATHRLRAVDNRQVVAGPSALSENHGPDIRAAMPSDSLVAVSDSDVQACSTATEYAVKIHDWAISLLGR